MNKHPTFYTNLLQRRFTGEAGLKTAERRELDLHLLICPKCNYDYAWLLMPHAPETASKLLRETEGSLTADLIAPYLRDLARIVQAGQPLTGFQRMLWRFLSRDREAMGQFRLIEAVM